MSAQPSDRNLSGRGLEQALAEDEHAYEALLGCVEGRLPGKAVDTALLILRTLPVRTRRAANQACGFSPLAAATEYAPLLRHFALMFVARVVRVDVLPEPSVLRMWNACLGVPDLCAKLGGAIEVVMSAARVKEESAGAPAWTSLPAAASESQPDAAYVQARRNANHLRDLAGFKPEPAQQGDRKRSLSGEDNGPPLKRCAVNASAAEPDFTVFVRTLDGRVHALNGLQPSSLVKHLYAEIAVHGVCNGCVSPDGIRVITQKNRLDDRQDLTLEQAGIAARDTVHAVLRL